jgi:hypothetical protein
VGAGQHPRQRRAVHHTERTAEVHGLSTLRPRIAHDAGRLVPPNSDGGAAIQLCRVEIWLGFYLYDVKFFVPAVNQYNNNVHSVWVPTFDYWQVKVFALNAASQMFGISEPATGTHCLDGVDMLP